MISTRHAEQQLVGRERERAALEGALAGVREGRGGIMLLAGDAGVGKTRLAEAVMPGEGIRVLRGDAPEQAPPPYGPLAAALRGFLRSHPGGLDACGPPGRYLRILLPELGRPPRDGDRAAVCEAVCCAFIAVARAGPAVVFLDDLHWADGTTLELLPSLAAELERQPVLLLGAYRTDEIPRDHPLRRMRVELRRAGRARAGGRGRHPGARHRPGRGPCARGPAVGGRAPGRRRGERRGPPLRPRAGG